MNNPLVSLLFIFTLFAAMSCALYQTQSSMLKSDLTHSANQLKTQLSLPFVPVKDGKQLYHQLNSQYSFTKFDYHKPNQPLTLFSANILPATDTAFSRLDTFLFALRQPITIQAHSFQLQAEIKPTNLQQHKRTLLINLIIIWGAFIALVIRQVHAWKKQHQDLKQITEAITQLSPSAPENDTQINSQIALPIAQALQQCQTQISVMVKQFEKEKKHLNKLIDEDPVTGLETKGQFMKHLQALTPTDKGFFALIHATELTTLNELHGREAGDNYLLKLVDTVEKAVSKLPYTFMFRIATNEFALFLPNTDQEKIQDLAEKIKIKLDNYQLSLGTHSIAHTGFTPYQGDNDVLNLLPRAEMAVNVAQTLGPNSFYLQSSITTSQLLSASQTNEAHWKPVILDLLKQKRIAFDCQPICPCLTSTQTYQELLARFSNAQSQSLPTTTVIAMAERYNLNIELDKLVTLDAIRLLLNSPKSTTSYGVNISTSSALDESFVIWLRELLGRQKQIADRLIFEICESGMQSNLAATYFFINSLHAVGARVCIERFGLAFTSFKFFEETKPDFIKLDSSYSKSINSSNNSNFFIKLIIDIARKLSIKVVATGIEHREQKIAMEQILVDGLQGYYIAKPESFTKQCHKTSMQHTDAF